MEKTKFDILFEEIQSKLIIKESVVNNCELCQAEILPSEADFNFDDFNGVEYSHLCFNCTEKLYDEYKEQIESGDAELHTKETRYENWIKCNSCEGLYPESELKDTDGGLMCDYCIDGDLSHGVPVSIHYN